MTAWGGAAFTAANSVRLSPCVGPAWLAAGDAALSFDPLSGQGILNALYTGLAAADAANRFLGGDRNALLDYAKIIDRLWDAYIPQLEWFYQAETRWRDSPFWSRRRARHPDLNRT